MLRQISEPSVLLWPGSPRHPSCQSGINSTNLDWVAPPVNKTFHYLEVTRHLGEVCQICEILPEPGKTEFANLLRSYEIPRKILQDLARPSCRIKSYKISKLHCPGKSYENVLHARVQKFRKDSYQYSYQHFFPTRLVKIRPRLANFQSPGHT